MINKIRKHFQCVPNLTSLIVWLLAVAVLAALTIHDFCALLTQYRNENIQTNADLQLENKSISLPDLTLCVDAQFQAFDDDSLWRGARNAAALLQEMNYGSNLTWTRSNVTLNELLGENVANSTAGRAVLLLLATFGFMDATPEHVQPSLAYLQNDYLELTNEVNGGRLRPLGDRLAQLGCADLLDVNEEYGPFRSDEDVQAYCSHLNADTETYRVETNSFCIPLPLANLPFDRNHDRMSVLIKTSPSFVFWNIGTLFDNAVGRYGTPMRRFYRETTQSLTINFRLASRVLLESEDLHCVNETSYDECMMHCRVQSVIDNCLCVPFSYRRWRAQPINGSKPTISVPFCSKTQYERCLLRYNNDTELMFSAEECGNDCQSLCSSSIYQWSFQEEMITNEDLRGSTLVLEFRPDSFSFMEFTLDRKMSTEQFLTQIGGLLNFYIGVSGLTLFTLLLWTVKQLQRNEKIRKAVNLRRFSKADDTSETSVVDPTNLIWQRFWLANLSAKTEHHLREQQIVETVSDRVVRSLQTDKVAADQTNSAEKIRNLEALVDQLTRRIDDLENTLVHRRIVGDSQKP